MALNDRQRLFCRLIAVEGLNQSAAYAQVFECQPNSAATLAGRLLKKVDVQEEIARLRQVVSTREERAAVAARVWSKTERMEQLQGWACQASEEGDFNAAVRCVAEMNRMDGAYEPEQVQVGVQGTFAALLREVEEQ